MRPMRGTETNTEREVTAYKKPNGGRRYKTLSVAIDAEDVSFVASHLVPTRSIDQCLCMTFQPWTSHG